MTQKEVYQWYKAHGICVRCHGREAEPYRVLCLECMEKQMKYESTRIIDKEKKAKQQRERMKKRKEQGICYKCKRKATHGVFCHEHYIYDKRMARERKKKGFGDVGLCRICGEPPVPGKKLCVVHHKQYSDCMIRNAKRKKVSNENSDN